MSLNVIIINWNNTAETLSCLESFCSWDRLPENIWVVDNASSDRGTIMISERYPSVRVIGSPVNRGFAGGNNLAIRRILEDGEAGPILLVNNDALLKEKDAALLMEALESDPHLGLIGPVIKNQKDQSVIWIGGGRDISKYLDSHIYLPDGPKGLSVEEPIHPVDYLPGTVALIRRRLFSRDRLVR